jgi:hypothetical protein
MPHVSSHAMQKSVSMVYDVTKTVKIVCRERCFSTLILE